MLFQLILFQMLILLPFLGGQLLKSRIREGFRERMIRFQFSLGLFFFDTLISLLVLWKADLHPHQLMLPLSGIVTVGVGLLLAHLWARHRFRNLATSVQGAFALSGALSNHGYTLGGAVCLLLMGQEGLELSMVYIIYFFPALFLIFIPYSISMSGAVEGSVSGFKLKRVLGLLFDRRVIPVVASFAGIGLAWMGVEPPPYSDEISLIAVAVNIASIFLAFGLSMEPRGIGRYFREALELSVVKFLALPLIISSLLILSSLFLPLKREDVAVVIIESFMPSAVYSVIVATLFGLDRERANAYFLWSTAIFLFFILPPGYLLFPYLFNL